jgi:ADP-ribosylglycohydrolase
MTNVESSPHSLEDRALGCLAGLAVGNVLGLSVESRWLAPESCTTHKVRIGWLGSS